jgi:diguanylate cyclase (GGDEF)-like protein
MPGPPLDLDDIFADSSPPRPRRRAPVPAAGGAGGEPFDLDAAFGADSAPAPARAAATGDIDLRAVAADSTPVRPAPAPRRGISAALGDAISSGYEKVNQFLRDPDPGYTTEAVARPDRRPPAPPTVASIVAGQPGFRADATRTAATPEPPAPPPPGNVPYRDPHGIATARAKAQKIASGEAALNPNTGQPYTEEERKKAAFVDHNLRFRQEREESKGGFGRRALDSMASGQVNAPAYIDIQSAQASGDLVTEKDLDDLGITVNRGKRLRTEPTFGESTREETLPAMAGQLPYFLLPESGALSQLSKGAAKIGAKSISEALALAAADAAPTAETFAGRAAQRMVTGGVPGAGTGAILEYGTERSRGASVEDALAGAAAGIPAGIALGGITNVVLGAAKDVASPMVTRTMGALRDRFRVMPPEVRLGEASKVTEAARAAEGKLPLADQTVDAQRAKIGKLLEGVLGEKQTAAREAGTSIEDAARHGAAARAEPVIEPGGAFRAREDVQPENRPLRTAAEAGLERRGLEPLRPAEEADAVRQMERAEAAAAEEQRMIAEQENDPDMRLERAAQERPGERQGPLTLRQTLEMSGEEAARGEPLAQDYHAAINKYVDALAAVKDVKEGAEPGAKLQVALTRAKRALNEARQRYGTQIGASAVLALAANDDDLTDEEKEALGYGGLAVLASTQLVRAIPRDLTERMVSGIERGIEAGTLHANEMKSAVDWVDELRGAHSLDPHTASALNTALHVEAGRLGRPELSLAEVKAALAKMGPNAEPGKFVSRVRSAVETLPGKRWDQPVPAADWIGKLKGMNAFKREELAMILPTLENAQAEKLKLSRADVLRLVDAEVPKIERVTLSDKANEVRGEPRGDGEGDADDIMDLDEINLDEEHPDVLREQAANREARISRIEEGITERQESAASEMQGAQEKVEEYRRDITRAIENEFPHLAGNRWVEKALDEAVEYIEEHVDAEYVPRGTVDKAMNILFESGEFSGPSEPTLPEGYHVATDDDGYYITGSGGRRLTEHHPTEIEAIVEGHSLGQFDAGSGDEHMLPRGYTVVEDDEGVRLLDRHGEELASGSDREEVIKDYIRDNWTERDTDDAWQTLRREIDSYADAFADYRRAESEHYYYTEGEAFDEEQNEISTLRDEIGQLEEAVETRGAPDAAQLALPLPEGGAPNDAVENPYLMPIAPEVKGTAKYSTYQRIGGGSNYRELLNVWENNPRRAYTKNHYGGQGFENVVGHIRVEDHTLLDTPDVSGESVVYHPGEPEDVRLAKSKVEEVRKRRAEALKKMDDLVRQHEALAEPEGQEARRLATEYGTLNNDVLNLAKREDELLGEVRDLKGRLEGADSPEPRRVAVMIESQSDWAQDASKYGVERQPTREEIARAEAMAPKIDEAVARELKAREEWERANAEWEHSSEPRRQAIVDLADAMGLASNDHPELRGIDYRGLIPNSTRYSAEASRIAFAVEPRLRDIVNQIEEMRAHEGRMFDARDAARDALMKAQSERTLMIEERDALLGSGADAGQRVPPSPFVETQAAFTLNAARFLIDSAERGYEQIAWSDAANRVRNAHLPMQAARVVYDEVTPSAMKKLLAGLGFKNVAVEKTFIRGNGHWTIHLTPEMREAIRKVGVPLLGVMALAALPETAKAQGADGPETASIYGTIAGSAAAAAALTYLAMNRKARRLVVENAELRRALRRDDLTGLGNGRAFRDVRAALDRDRALGWAVFDGHQFKKINDTLGHAAGDRALAHFGDTVRRVAADMGARPHAFRNGGDEFAIGLPKELLAEFVQRIEQESKITVHGNDQQFETMLTGAHADTYDAADALANARKAEMRRLDPSLNRRADDPPGAARRPGTPPRGSGVTAYSNPIGPALSELRRAPGAATVAAVGALALESDTEEIHDAGVPLIALGALAAIGSRRLIAGKDLLADKLVQALSRTEDGTRLIRFFNPDALLSDEVKEAIAEFERGRAKGAARAAEFSQKAKGLGPSGDRAASDVIEGEGWEDTSDMSGADLTAVLSVAVELQQEYERVAQEKIAAGVMDPGSKIPDYAGARRYAYFDTQSALAESPQATARSRASGRNPRIGAQKARTLDIPVREAERALRDAEASGDAAAVSAAKDALDQARVVQMSQRVERGEIREQSYRAAYTIEKGYADAEAGKLFNALRSIPGTAHPEWVQAIDDLRAAQSMGKAATSQADRDAAKSLVDEAQVKLAEVTRRFSRKGGEWVTLPDSPGMGAMRGAVVQRDVANSLVGFSNRSNAYTKLLQWWKEAKTVFNPGTSAANIMSNIAFSHLEGLSIHEQPVFLTRALKDMKKYGDATRALAERGVLDQNAVTSSSLGKAGKVARGEEALEQLLPTTRPETQKVLREQGITEGRIANKKSAARGRAALGGAATGAALMYDSENPEDATLGGAAGAAVGAALVGRRGAFRQFYQSEDNVFRVALYLKRRSLGDSEEQAAKFAGEALGNFRSRSPALAVARQTVAPFILYPAKALPRFAQRMIDNPVRYLTLMAAWGTLNELSKQEVGEVPDSDVAIRDRRSALGYFLPGFTQLPFTNERGERAAVDMARWTPVAAATTMAPPGSVPGSMNERAPDIARAGGPVIDLAARFGANVDTYTGEPRYKRDYPPKENIGRLLNDAAETVLPQALGFHRERLSDDIANKDWDKFKNDLLGPTGLRPRYVRPGANLLNASFTLESSLREMKQQLKLDLRNNRDPERVQVLTDRYRARIAQALANFKDRIGAPPPDDLVREYLDDTDHP